MEIRKVVAYTALHYGRDYLEYAIKSVIADVDEFIILYSSHGSHSIMIDEPCPETRSELYAIAENAAGDKLKWIDGDWFQEHQQRESIYQYTDADMIFIVDSDEVYAPGLAKHLVKLAPYLTKRFLRVPFYHYWRSLKKVIKYDPAFPERVILPYLQSGETTFQIPPWLGDDFRVHHFGYAQNSEIVRYKMKIHGHLGQFKPGWFENTFMTNAQKDCHPVGSEYWNPQTCEVPEFMQSHKYAGLDLIP